MDDVTAPKAKPEPIRSAGRPPELGGERMKKMLRVRLPDVYYDQLQQYCEDNEESMSDIVRESLIETGVLKRVS